MYSITYGAKNTYILPSDFVSSSSVDIEGLRITTFDKHVSMHLCLNERVHMDALGLHIDNNIQ